MEGKKKKNILTMLSVFLVCGCAFWGHTINLEASDDTYIVVDDMEDYNDRDDIREVWTDGYADGSSGSNLNVSTAVGSPFNGATGPALNYQAMVLRYDNDGMTYSGLPGDEKPMYPVPYYSEIEANTVGDKSLDIGQNWAAAGFKELSLWFQGHPISDGDYDANGWPSYRLIGRGRDIGGRHDEFYFLSQYPFVGDGEIAVQVGSMDNTDPWAKAGIMIREKWTPYSKYAAVFMTPGQGVTFQYRDVDDGPTTSITKPGVSVPQYVRLVRNISGAFEAQHSANGFFWYDVNAPGSKPVYPEIEMGETNLYAGTAVSSHNSNQTCSADFNNVYIDPLPPNWIFGNIGTNDPEQLYVALSDGVNTSVVEQNDAGAATLTSWQEWKIPLTAFTGVDFSSIKKVYIGLGDRGSPVAGGSGAVYIDNIGLYKHRLLFVDADAPTGGDGSSWTDAFNYLQDALSAALPDNEIRVAQGIYKPDQGSGITPGDRTATFQLINGVTIEGGYAGFGEPDPDAREIGLYETMLSGDLNGDDEPNFVNNGDNSYHVVTGSGNNAMAVLDGFTITGGNTTGDGGGICGNGTEATIANCVITNNNADGSGGGVSNCSGTIMRCTITGNTAGYGGGGIYVLDCNVTVEDCYINYNVAADGGGLYCLDSLGVTITRCTISDNDANGRGGGIFVFSSPILIEDCRISRNNSTMSGGGVYLAGDVPASGGVPRVRQCLITENTAGEEGGGISFVWQVEPIISNCTIADNQVTGSAGVGYGGGLYCSFESNVEVINSIIWGNFAQQGFQVAVGSGDPPYPLPSRLALSHSDVEGGPGGAYVGVGSTLDWGIGAIDSDPQLADPIGGDWHLGAGSPCIDAGDNSVVTVPTDLDGNPRIVNGTVDMGAYEFQGPFLHYYHVDGVNGDNSNDGLTKETAFATIQKGINSSDDGDTVLVWPGVYNEAATQGINFKGKGITVTSAADAAVLEVPGFTAVTFAQGEDGNSIFSNFVVRGSSTGILTLFANPTISNVTVVDNDNGVIADNADPEITNCIFYNNFNGDLFGSPDPIEAKYSWIEGDVNEPNMPAAGLISHWKFDEGGGLIAYDSAGNNDAVVLGAIWTNSPFGNALDFDGVDDYVIVSDDDSLDITDNITISSWVRPYVELNNQFIVAKWQDSEIDSSYGCRLEYSTLKFFLAKDNTKTSQAFSDFPVVTNTWNHVVVSWDGNLMRGYLNGIASSETESFAGPINVTIEPLEIGYNPGYGGGAGGAYFNGTIDEVAIYNRALSAEEVEQIYQPLANPLFADAAGDDYHLLSERGRYWPAHDVWVLDDVTSPCVDGGDPNVNPMNERMPNGGRINMGAYGNTAYASMSECRGKADINCDGIVNFKDLAFLAQFWLEN